MPHAPHETRGSRQCSSPAPAASLCRGAATITRRPFPVGLALGRGTGPQLGAVFCEALERVGALYGVEPRVLHADRLFAAAAPRDAATCAGDAGAYEAFLRRAATAGVGAVFRTSFGARALYTVRERLAAVKLDRFATAHGDMLLVRDQTQGYYSATAAAGAEGAEDGEDADIVRVCRFSHARTRLVIDYALRAAREAWGQGAAAAGARLLVVTKVHLLDERFERWVRDAAAAAGGPAPLLLQPEAAQRALATGALRGRLLVVGSNEWSNTAAYELARASAGAGGALDGSAPHDLERFCRNVYLAKGVEGLVEYQTAHGSADDLEGADSVNPGATLRAAAHMLEAHAGCGGAMALMARALAAAAAAGALTPDRGGSARCSEVVQAVLAAAEGAAEAVAAPAAAVAPAKPAGRQPGEVLVLVDLQAEFCSPSGRFVRGGEAPAALVAGAVRGAAALLCAARAGRVPVVWVRTLYDARDLPPPVAARLAAAGRAAALEPGVGGGAFYGAAPAPGEHVVSKQSYSGFEGTSLEAELTRLGARRLVFGGVFADVCVAATALGAYARGLQVTIAADAVAPLDAAPGDALGYLQKYCAARVASVAELAGEWGGAADPAAAAANSGCEGGPGKAAAPDMCKRPTAHAWACN